MWISENKIANNIHGMLTQCQLDRFARKYGLRDSQISSQTAIGIVPHLVKMTDFVVKDLPCIRSLILLEKYGYFCFTSAHSKLI